MTLEVAAASRDGKERPNKTSLEDRADPAAGQFCAGLFLEDAFETFSITFIMLL